VIIWPFHPGEKPRSHHPQRMLTPTNNSIFTTIDLDENVVLYPSFGHQEPNGRYWRIYLRGMVHDPVSINFQKRLMLNFIGRMMNASPDDLQSPLFQERLEGFLVGPRRGRQIVVRIGRHVHAIRKTNRRGHFFGKVRITNDQLVELADEGYLNDGWLRYDVALADHDERRFTGAAHLSSPQGFSVISDIDDTIKHTEVLCRQSMLANTFLREFRPIEGMADFYQQLADLGATFHYVSYSPWQMFQPLADFSSLAGYPQGPFHLRSFQLSKHMLGKLLLSRSPGKATVVRWILRSFPNRRFLLVGDSGQHDPEIYGAAARKYPHQVAGILIREVKNGPLSLGRLGKAFANLDHDTWSVFEDPKSLELPLVMQRVLGHDNTFSPSPAGIVGVS
jgi:phosphatidate phosphatase APP1